MSPRRSLAGDEEADVVVVGAGLTGCAVACELRRRHLRTVLIDAHAAGSSETRLGHVPTGPAELYPHEAGPRREAAREQWQWMREGHERLRAWMSTLGVDCRYRAAGGFLMAATREEAALLAEAEDALREDTFSSEFLDHYMLEARFDVTGLAAGLWMCDDADLDAARLVRALADEAESRGSAVFERTAATRLEAVPGGVTVVTAAGRVRAREAIVCAGAGTLDLVPEIAPLWRRVTVASATYTLASPALPTPARLLGGGLAWRRDGDRVRASAFASTADETTLARERDELVARHLPAVRGPSGATGALGATRDGWPAVGRIGSSRVLVASGFGDGALAWAPLAAAWVVAALTGGSGVPPHVAPGRRAPLDS